MRTEVEMEMVLKNLFEKRNFIVHQEKKVGKFRADLIIEKDSKKFLVEIKNVDQILPSMVYQIASYLIKYKEAYGIYLAIPFETYTTSPVEELIKRNGIGLIRFNQNNFEITIEPKGKDNILNMLTSDDSDKILKKYNLSKKEKDTLVEDIAKKSMELFNKSLDKKEISNFPKNILLFVIIASLLGSSLWEIIQLMISLLSNNFLSWIIPSGIVTLCLSILGIYWVSNKRKLEK